jgi:membrane-associated HD superfamily phosphohydrolase
MTARVKDELLQNVSLASGMVQAGERIVDRGEIIDGYTYNVLRSLKIVYENKTGGNQRMGMILGGQFVLVMGIMLCMWLYLVVFPGKDFS